MRASEFVSEVKGHDFMAGHCHVMAMALKQLHPDWQIRAHVGYDDDAADDTEYRVDHVYTVAPDGTAYDCRGRFDNEQQLVGPDTTGGVDTQYVNFGPEEIKQAMLRGELKRFTKQDLANAMQVATQAGKQDVSEAPAGYKEIEFVCVNPQFPDATDPALQKKMYRGLKQIDGVVPLWQEWGDYSEGQASLSAIYQDSDSRDKILSLAKQLGVEVDLEQAVSDDYVDRAMRGEHEGQQAVIEEINPDILNPRFSHTQKIGDYTYIASVEIFLDEPLLNIKAYDGDKEIGHVLFQIVDWEDGTSNSYMESGGTDVDPKYRGKGVAATMYAYAKMLGNDIIPSFNRTADGKAMWAGWGQDAKHLRGMTENFADGRHPEDKGDSQRHGIPKNATMAELEKASHAKGRKGQLARWQLNMRRGKKKTNETVIGTLHFPKLIIAVDDHAIDRTRTRGISPATIDQSLRKLNGIADQLGQMESSNTVWVYDVSNNIALGLRRTSSQGMRFTLKTVVADRPFDGTTPIIELT